ncbi:MAG: lamin tail domain-containing protein [Anaerolineae bacterium]|jgi:phosphatidylserine/phosphatidylglycerophosphate/cardiolipin synthase-like enzyme|nr:lamin tail domain-containing protein [Anaerolineae bacterium]MDH7473714.1 lamin tail domain-containing protein [Anaerolineae bacterium]
METRIRHRVKLLLLALALGVVAAVALLAWMSHGAAAKPPAQSGDPPAGILISAVYPDGYTPSTEYDEAFRLTNVSIAPVTLTEAWQVRDASGRVAVFSGTTLIGPGQSLWCARRAVDFERYFGFKPDLEWENSDPAVPDMFTPGSALQFRNAGGQLFLLYTRINDTANDGCTSGWYAGSNPTASQRASMERRDPTDLDVADNWATATATNVGLDANGNPITGTPKAANSVLSGTLAHRAGDVVINEVAWMGTAASAQDEWIELRNNTDQDIDLNGWTLAAADGSPTIALTGTIPAGGYYLLERTDDTTVSNIPADQVYTGDLNNNGEVLVLRNDVVVDAFVYGDGDTNVSGWSGEAVQPYPGYSSEGQILYRKRNESTALPLPDTDIAADWAQSVAAGANLFGPVDEGDIYGKKVQYPGWDLDTFTQTLKITRTATLTIAVAPDNSYETVRDFFQSAQESIHIEGYTFENAHLTGVITEALQRGITVTVLLDGDPTSGMTDQERWICQQIADAGGNVYLMHNNPAADVHDRYAYQHAKFAIVDGERVLIGSENFGYNAMPADDKSDGTFGHRGVILITDAPEIVAHVQSIFAADCDPTHHNDIVLWGSVPSYTVPIGYTPVYTSGGWSYGVQFPTPFVLANTTMAFEVVQSPETSLRQTDGLLAMVARAGMSDTVLVEQMYEHPYWGNNVEDDPNPRLEAYIAAARRGATVRILLDSYYDNPDKARSNTATCAYVNTIAVSETLDLECRLGNPAGLGIHNKMVLVDDAQSDDDYLHVGSLNGTATSAKVNRELALQVRSAAARAYLTEVFEHDWASAPPQFPGARNVYLPLVMKDYVPVADHVLISEVLYDPPGNDTGKEWIELYNPTASTVNLAGFRLGDAVNSGDYERLYQFPDGAQIGPGETLVIAQTAAGFRSLGYSPPTDPDYEWNDTDLAIPNLIPSDWGNGEFALSNNGDEVLLLDATGAVVDVVVYGTGSYPGVVPFADLSPVHAGNSLERWPANRDSDNCARDFRVRYVPAPGSVVVW